jgi:hypothetical protein
MDAAAACDRSGTALRFRLSEAGSAGCRTWRLALPFDPPAKFFVNRGVVSNAIDVYHLLRPLVRQVVTYRYHRGPGLASWGRGPVDRIVLDRPDVSSYFTPVSICINVASFEYLEFETLPGAGIEYRLVQGDERVIIQASTGDFADLAAGHLQQSLDLDVEDAGPHVQMGLGGEFDRAGEVGDVARDRGGSAPG